MKPERWQQIEQLFHAALERAPDERAAFLDEACDGDGALRQEVESLLAYDEPAQRFIATPPDALAAELLAAEQAPSLIGSSLNHYQILSRLGRGGMGEVYLATDTRLGRKVAVKLLPEEFTRDAERMRRFEQEARAASALNHPNIITIHEIGEVDQHHFIISEFVEGETLRQRMKSGPLEPEAALEIAAQVASALQAAHRAGIVHRDIKPENVMLRPDGLVKVLDFGLAKLTGPQPPADDSQASTLDRLSTETGMVMGTLRYMSPEQARGLKVDHRTDIFSLGVIIYEMIAGRRPFEGATTSDVIVALLAAEPSPLKQHCAAAPAELEQVVNRCLAKERDARYQAAEELLAELKQLRLSGQPEKVAATRKIEAAGMRIGLRRRAGVAALAAALLLVVGLFGLFVWQPWRAPGSTEPLRADPLTTLPGVTRYPSFSPDGSYVAFTWNGSKQNNPDIYVQQIGSGSPLRLTTDPSNDYNPVWSPDGRLIAFLRSQVEASKSELRLIPPLGGPERKLADIRVRGGYTVTPPYVAWCPDSTCLVVTDSPSEGKPDALFVVSLETGEKRPLTNPQLPATGDTNPAVSPDGRWLIFRRQAALYNGELYRLPLGKNVTSAGEPGRLTPAALNAQYPTWMPDSKEILFSVRGGLMRLAVTGESTPVRLPFVGQDGLMPVVSRPQPGRPPRLVYVRSFQNVNIWRVEISAPGVMASLPPAVFISSTREQWFPQFSPDGRQVAFASNRLGEGGIWVADADGSNAVQLASMGVFATGAPRWSPDGKLIAFHSGGDVYVISVAGGKPRNLISHPAIDGFPSFSRDGQWIYFASNRTGEWRVWKIPAAGGDAVRVTDSVGYAPVESPDGAYIYYVETIDKPSPLWRMPVSGGVPVKMLEEVFFGNYAVLERGIYYMNKPAGQGGVYYLDKPSGETQLQYFDFATRRSTTVARNLGNVDAFLTASPDGRTLLYCRVDSSVDDLLLVENFR
jgi:serine/threonine protein kinase